MKASINLYHSEFRPSFEWVTGQHLLALIVLSCMLSGAFYAMLFSWQRSVEAQIDHIAQSVTQEQRNIDEFTLILQTRTSNPLLGAQLDHLQRQTASQQTLLMRIEDMGELKQKSFSQLFDALAKADSDDVWLTTFIVNENDLSISGSLAKPSALTKWIGELSNTPFFNGQEFDDALIIRGDQGLTFHLTSTQKTSDLLAGKGAKNASE